jgi:hypothetical protein
MNSIESVISGSENIVEATLMAMAMGISKI